MSTNWAVLAGAEDAIVMPLVHRILDYSVGDCFQLQAGLTEAEAVQPAPNDVDNPTGAPIRFGTLLNAGNPEPMVDGQTYVIAARMVRAGVPEAWEVAGTYTKATTPAVTQTDNVTGTVTPGIEKVHVSVTGLNPSLTYTYIWQDSAHSKFAWGPLLNTAEQDLPAPGGTHLDFFLVIKTSTGALDPQQSNALAADFDVPADTTTPTDPTPTDPTTPTTPTTPVAPPFVRHVSRHLQQTVTQHLRRAMVDLGWVDPPKGVTRTVPVPFDAQPFVFQVGRKSESEMQAIRPNLLAVTFGEEPAEEEQELGAGVQLLQTAVSIDVVPDNEALGLALANDLRDVLTGRLPGYRRVMDMNVYDADAAGVPAPGYQIHFEDVQRRRNDNVDFRLYWQQVIALVELYLPGWD